VNSKFGDMSVLVHAAQAEAFDARRRSRRPAAARSTAAGPEAEPAGDLEPEEGTEHVKARMREIQHAEHAEDDGKAARHQKQQHCRTAHH